MGKRKPNVDNRNGSKPNKDNLQDEFANSERNKNSNNSRDAVNERNEKNFDRHYNRNRTGNQNRGKKTTKETFGFSNDWTWYAKDAQQVRDFASLSFNSTLGYPIELPHTKWSEEVKYAAPGIMALHLLPTPGISVDQYSAINVASDQMVQFIRSKVSGARDYDAANFMMYIMAMDSLFSYYAYLKRIYGVMNNYEVVNRYLPRVLLQAMGANYDDLMEHMADFRGYINQFANTLSTWPVPNTMSLITKHVWMYSNVYKDADNDYAQLYLYTPAGFYYYDQEPLSQDPPKPAQLNVRMIKMLASPGRPLATVNDLISFGRQMYQDFVAGGWAQIKGDILNAYGGNIFSISGIDESEIVRPVYNSEVLAQINNTRIWDGLDDVSIYRALKWQIVEEVPTVANRNPYLVFTPKLSRTLSTVSGRGSWIINFHKQNPTPEDVIVATRNMFLTDEPTSSTQFPDVKSCGSELCLGAYIYTISQNVGNPALNPINVNYFKYHTDMLFDYNETDMNDLLRFLRSVGMSSNFDWHPLNYFVCYASSDNTPQPEDGIIYPYGDLNTYTVVQETDIINMNDVAIRSLFGVPMQI